MGCARLAGRQYLYEECQQEQRAEAARLISGLAFKKVDKPLLLQAFNVHTVAARFPLQELRKNLPHFLAVTGYRKLAHTTG